MSENENTNNEEIKDEVKSEQEVCAVAPAPVADPKISIDQFKDIQIKIGKILSVEIVPDADKLLKLSVDMGEESPRQILSGIRMYFEDPQSLVGKKVPFVANLAPRVIRGLESNGMILAVNDKDGNGFSLLEVGENISAGSLVG
ncbi:MAG: methionine--tRNA ligase subunit beta [Candidatus Pacebacteria bacterium]|nr:methionine--tRNA ligase subunit beta [Candidatus Paceibacterota bacterium]